MSPPPRPVKPAARQPIAPRPISSNDLIDDSEIEVVNEPRRSIGRESVKEHVKRHINTGEIAEQVSHLGEQVGLADDKLEARLHDKFDHEVGALDHGPDPYENVYGDVKKKVSPIVELLRNPKTFRQALIVSEILKRPNLD
ncbi:MAG: hypothetical protein R3C03_04725 [Pirellulaceae bacterium]